MTVLEESPWRRYALSSFNVCCLHCKSLAVDSETSRDNVFHVFRSCSNAFSSTVVFPLHSGTLLIQHIHASHCFSQYAQKQLAHISLPSVCVRNTGVSSCQNLATFLVNYLSISTVFRTDSSVRCFYQLTLSIRRQHNISRLLILFLQLLFIVHRFRASYRKIDQTNNFITCIFGASFICCDFQFHRFFSVEIHLLISLLFVCIYFTNNGTSWPYVQQGMLQDIRYNTYKV